MAGRSWHLLVALLVLSGSVKSLSGQSELADRSSVLDSSLAQLHASPVANRPFLSDIHASSPKSGGMFQLQRMVRSAGIIFSGRVVEVGHGSFLFGRGGQSSTTVSFRVEHAIRGANPGEKLTIHEWAGLWDRGEHYRVGERVFLFLYAPGKLGLSSPVAGTAGRFAMNERDELVFDALHAQIFAANPAMDGKASMPYSEFARIVRLASGEE
jgi:hypothetical protein